MSKTILSHITPEKIKGKHLDYQMKLKISNTTEKVLKLHINIQSPKYDEAGKPVYVEDEDEEDQDINPHYEYFNAHLLDEEYLDSQPYHGEASDEEVKP